MIDFRQMTYERPDMEAVTACYRNAAQQLRSASAYPEARKAFFDLQDTMLQVETMFSLAYVRNTIDTTDAFYEAEVLWLQEQSATLIPLKKDYLQALASSPFRKDFEAEFGAQLLRRTDAELKISDERLIPDTIREGELQVAYSKSSAAAVTDFRGEKVNFYGLLKHMQSTDRAERKEAFEAWAALYEKISPELDSQYEAP